MRYKQTREQTIHIVPKASPNGRPTNKTSFYNVLQPLDGLEHINTTMTICSQYTSFMSFINQLIDLLSD